MDIFKMLEEHYISADAICGSLMDGIIIASANGSFLYWNGPARFYMGNNQKDVPPEDWAREYGIYDLKGERLLNKEELPLIRALNGEEFYEERFLTKNINFPDGIILSVSGRPLRSGAATVGAVITFKDISQQILLEKNLASQQDFYKNILDIMPGYVFIKDLDSKYIYGNKNFQKLLGATSFVGKKTEDFFNEESTKQIHDHDNYVIKSGKSKTFEEVVYWKDNSRSILLTTRFPYRDSHNQIKGVCVVFRDITKELDSGRDILITKNRNLNASKIAIMGILAFEISGKIIGPLNQIRSLNDAIITNLKQNKIDIGELHDYIKEVDHSIKNIAHAAETLNKYEDVYSFSQLGNLTIGEIFKIVESIVEHRLSLSGIDWDISELKNPDCKITNNNIELTELILNLIIIALVAVVDCEKKKISIGTEKNGNLIIKITHTCAGKETSGITTQEGVAWSISQSICERNKWFLEHVSLPDSGEFRLIIP